MSHASAKPAVMRWAAAHSELPDSAAAAAAVASALAADLGFEPPDLAIAFFGARHVARAEGLAEVLRRELRPACLIGCGAHGVISREREIESGPALTVIAARLPGVRLDPFIITNESWVEAAEDPLAFARFAPDLAGAELVLMLADPFSLDVERCLLAFNRYAPGLRVVGGLAGAGPRPGTNALVLNQWVASEGGVALAFSGAVRADVVVSQGCRPVGPPLEVTRAQGNLLVELDGRPALERAEQVLQELSAAERETLKNGLYVGRPVRAEATGRGDYLIRNLLGADRDRGVIAIGDQVAERQRIRLHVRDAATAREDLELLLSPQSFDSAAGAALLFACNGRGRGLYGEADRDITALQSALGGGIPAAGMFCAGEIGPVGGVNHLHGHTAGIAILRPK